MVDILLLAFYILDLLLLSLFGINTYLLIFLSRRNLENCTSTAKPLRRHPTVTVQLPVFNERLVVERLIAAAVHIRYPKEQLEIQVLDDSTDETLEVSRGLVERYAAQGYRITLLHRQRRDGHKAGALREGLRLAAGELILVFDADFLPEPSILERVLPYFEEDERLGLVQTRWGHVNPDYSFLTKAQAMMIDAHFMVDQVARSSEGLFFSFNGTAGVWRRRCILDAGNWQADTLTEDLDLSYRASLKGWRMKYLRDVVSPAEIPITLQAYKSQQYRWAKGSVQTALKLGRQVLASPRRLFSRFDAFMHLVAYAIHPLILLNILLFIPILLRAPGSPLLSRLIDPLSMLFSLAMIGPVLFLVYAQRVLYRDWLRRLRWLPFALILGTGLAVNNTRAVLDALLGRPSEFIRTPKWGVVQRGETRRPPRVPPQTPPGGRPPSARVSPGMAARGTPRRERLPFGAVELMELAVGLYMAAGLVYSVLTGNLLPALPCLVYSASFLTLFVVGIRQARQGRPRAALASAVPQPD